MPHGESWLTLFLRKFFPGFWHWLSHDASKWFGWPLNSEGLTWVEHQPIRFQHVFSAAFVVLVVSVLAILTIRRNRKPEDAIVPEGTLTASSFVEMFVDSTYAIMKDIMGPRSAKYFLPLIGTCAFFIFFSNLMGLIPGMAPPTSNLNTTLACASVIFFSTHIFGIKEHGVVAYFKHFVGPVDKIPLPRSWPLRVPVYLALMVLASLMLLIETISHLVRPASLTLRLGANIDADHQVLDQFFQLLGKWSFIPVPLAVMVLGSMVVIVQTLVFCILSTVYISIAVAHEEH
jgi:F-type H+-transporting ATPase subunit a